MKRIFLALILMTGMNSFLSAQYVDNALLFSQQNYGSTARSKAMGNAFGALGGDFGSLSINPAGIGIYQRGEISVTMGALNQNSTETTYQGTIDQESSSNMHIKNFGYVSVMPAAENSNGIISFNFGLGSNRLANLNQRSYTSAPASTHSRMDAFAQNTNGIVYTDLVSTDNYDPYNKGIPWESKLAWENYLIDIANPTTGNNQYNSFLFSNEKVKQEEFATHEGYLNEYLATFGMNINHTFYLGASFNMQELFYDEAKLYKESGDWGKFDYSNNSRTTGVGYNLKIGAIYRPVSVLRLGLALHTPTYFNIKESYSSVMSSTLTGFNTDANGSHYEETPVGNYNYNYRTPLRAIGSIAFQFAKKGLLSMDYEYVNYGSMRFNHGDDGYGFGSENGDIKSVYKSVGNIRIGAEYRLTEQFSIRGGAEFLGNPYQSTVYGLSQPNADYSFKTYNGGIGYRRGNFSIDMTYGLGDRTNYMYLYQVDGVNVEPVKYHSLRSELLFTLAFKI